MTGNSCAKPERAVEFLDDTFGFEGCKLLASGIEGTHWEYKDGKPVLPEAVPNGRKTDTQYHEKEGFLYGSLSGCGGSQPAADGYPVDIMLTDDVDSSAGLTQVDKDYITHFGSQFQYPSQVVYDMVKQGKGKTWSKNWVFPQLGVPADGGPSQRRHQEHDFHGISSSA